MTDLSRVFRASVIGALFLYSIPAIGSAQSIPAKPVPADEACSQAAEKLGITSDGTIFVSRFALTGNTVFPEADLHALISSWEDKKLTIKDICSVLNKIKGHYQAAGYPYAGVVIPPQQMEESGILRLNILEGRVNSIKIQGNRRYSSGFIRGLLGDMAPGQIVSMKAYQKGAVLLNTTPGIKAQVAVQPAGPENGLFDVLVQISEEQLQGSISTDNNIRSEFGTWQAKFHVDLYNPSGRGDRLSVEPSIREHKVPNGILLDYKMPVGRQGTSLQVMFLKANFQFLTNSPLMGLQNDVTYTIFQVNHPLKLSFQKNILFSVGALRVTSRYLMTGSFNMLETVYLLTSSVIYMQGQPGKAMTNAFAQFSTNFRRNPDGLRNNAEPARLDLVGGHERWFKPNLSLFLFGIGILSLDPLLSSQKVIIGGPYCVRGFGVNEAMGDQGYLVKAELRRQLQLPRRNSITFRTTLDHGSVYRRFPDPMATVPDTELKDHLFSAGLGLTAKLLDHLQVSIDWSHPLNDHPIRDRKYAGRFWWGLSASF